jgi:hypothetical protein
LCCAGTKARRSPPASRDPTPHPNRGPDEAWLEQVGVRHRWRQSAG